MNIDEILRNAPVSDGHSRTLEEVMAELGLEFEDDDLTEIEGS